jgi:glycosyltransferase involved in cell wall biosynthesis
MLKVGFGLTALSRGLSRNHVDGIGVYTQELFQELSRVESLSLMPFVLGKEKTNTIKDIYQLHPAYHKHVLSSQFLNQKIKLSKDDFFPNIIHATDHQIPVVKNVPVIATIMDLITIVHPEWVRYRFRHLKNWLFKNKILTVDHIITISEYSKNDLMHLFNIPEEKISVTSLGMNPQFYERLSELDKNEIVSKYNLKKDFFLFVGTLQPRKNLEKALDAHALLTPEQRKQHPFVIVGNPGWAREELLKKIAQAEEKGFVRWLKYLSSNEVKALLQSALAMVYVSLYEGFGLPIIEAFASQCPVITSNVTSIPEVAGDAAIQVSPLDIEEIHVAMENLIDSQELRNQLIQKGLERAEQFSWQNCAKQTLDVYRKTV